MKKSIYRVQSIACQERKVTKAQLLDIVKHLRRNVKAPHAGCFFFPLQQIPEETLRELVHAGELGMLVEPIQAAVKAILGRCGGCVYWSKTVDVSRGGRRKGYCQKRRKMTRGDKRCKLWRKKP